MSFLKAFLSVKDSMREMRLNPQSQSEIFSLVDYAMSWGIIKKIGQSAGPVTDIDDVLAETVDFLRNYVKLQEKETQVAIQMANAIYECYMEGVELSEAPAEDPKPADEKPKAKAPAAKKTTNVKKTAAKK